MKKFLVIMFLSLFITGCSFNKEDLKNTNQDHVNKISMSIKEGTLTRSGASIVITDLSGKKNVYGTSYRLDKKEDGVWRKAKIIFEGNYAFTLPAFYVDKNNKLEMDINWEVLYGKLDDGEYRIVKDVLLEGTNDDYDIYAEFIIE